MRSSTSLWVRISLVALVCILILGYGFFQARNLILGPKIEVTTPISGTNVADPLVIVSGTATNITKITLNDRPIFIDKQGKFSEKLLVPAGYTIIKLAAQDKFGRSTEKRIELNYTAPQITSSTSATSTQNIIQ